MKGLTFKEIYDSLPTASTPPKTAWIRHIAEVTKKSEITIRGWLSKGITPDPLTVSIIERELGVPAEVLFPTENR